MDQSSARTSEIVDAYYRAWGSGDFDGLRPTLTDDFRFDGPLMTADSPDAYITKTKENAAMFAGSDYRNVGRVVDGDHAVILAELAMGPVTLHTAEHFTIRDGKIASVRLYFDPTPLQQARAGG